MQNGLSSIVGRLVAALPRIVDEVAADVGLPPDHVEPSVTRLIAALQRHRRLTPGELGRLREEGARAAREGRPLHGLIDQLLSTGWAVWEAAGREANGASPAALIELGSAIMRAAAAAAAALAEGYSETERALAARTAAVRRAVLDELFAIPMLEVAGVARVLRRSASAGLDPTQRYRLLLVRVEREIEDEGPIHRAVERMFSRALGADQRLSKRSSRTFTTATRSPQPPVLSASASGRSATVSHGLRSSSRFLI